jgi:uroporphyrinogen-III decarboxylase
MLAISDSYTLPLALGAMLSQPQMLDILERLVALAKESQKSTKEAAAYTREMNDLGFPVLWRAVTLTAFDWVSDYLRGMRGSMMDMFQVPDKLLAAIDLLTPFSIGNAVMMAQQTGNKGAFIPMHRGADGFMSDEQFAKFYWPSFKALIMGLINAGLTPIPVFEGGYNSRLKYLSELPPGKIIGHFDIIDRKKAKEAIGDVMCFWGNIPPSKMCAGTPADIETDVRELIEIFGENGGLIIDSTLGIPDEAKPENVRAMVEATRKYGTWR